MTELRTRAAGSSLRPEQMAPLEAGLEAAQGRIAELEVALVAAQGRIAQLGAENATLRERLGQNSRNSSRPPSTDPPREKRQSTPAGMLTRLVGRSNIRAVGCG